MNKVQVTEKAQLDKFYEDWSLTFEGLDPSDIDEGLADWLKGCGCDPDKATAHIIQGSLMNRVYKLSGDNAYQDNLSIIAVTGIDKGKVTLPRFQVGGRWFTDIVDNNARHQREINRKK